MLAHSGGFRTSFRKPGIAESLKTKHGWQVATNCSTFAWGRRKKQKTWFAKIYVVLSIKNR
jgi:hypothetical protein